ncbi:hypothetical protein [Agrococcus sp. Marseille-P2731]|uniref:hypothetical protein n=1 Tax=Agrococcus sp. Marseille-P2731 TaxID=1841862 RepID=UPI000930B380|nr:hypothetical protein [Agrococcus sp. Marseille-P2731]
MEITPVGKHEIRVIEGNAEEVTKRGRAIVTLGFQMTQAAETMNALLEDGAEQEGQWIDKLKEASREVNDELERAGSLYSDVGPYVRDYGLALGEVKTAMTPIVSECQRLWDIYVEKRDAADDAESMPVAYPTGERADDPDARQQAEQDQQSAATTARTAADNAYADWSAEAAKFDTEHDTWWEEFDAACNGIETATTNGIEDSWKDNLDGLVAFVQTVLSIAGLVLAVLALVVGGPIVGLLALIVGVIALGLTIYQFCRGDANGWDLAFAIVGVLPIGAIGDFASGGLKTGFKSWIGLSNGMSFTDDAARWGLSLTGSGFSPATWASNMRGLAPEAGYLVGEGTEMFAEFISTHGGDTWQALGDLGHTPWALAYTADAVGNYFGVVPGMVRDTIQAGTGMPDLFEQIRWPTY